ncbi:hypothetical protein, partial [Sporobacter termitidis]|uniref:hypothetical protein n=1 Tax=Sporobacter termitidis TaxID=44749 RepID=UPI001A9A2CA2
FIQLWVTNRRYSTKSQDITRLTCPHEPVRRSKERRGDVGIAPYKGFDRKTGLYWTKKGLYLKFLG